MSDSYCYEAYERFKASMDRSWPRSAEQAAQIGIETILKRVWEEGFDAGVKCAETNAGKDWGDAK